MISVILSWCWIGATAFLWGYSLLSLFNKHGGYSKREWDVACIMGICGITTYAQFFSLFYKVGLAANIVLLITDILILIAFRKYIVQEIYKLKEHIKYFLLFVVIAFVVMILTTQVIAHYDTFLYHAQSIRWIEEYGVVKGLGNLHNRLAYNSAIFSLEALFSMKFLVGRSMHTVNGFCVAFFLGYAICSFKSFRQKDIYVSDFLRIAMILFIGYKENIRVISSSGSDLLAIGLVIYIFIKWVSYLEEGEKQVAPFAYLCIIAVFAVTVKLSAAMIVLLVISPAIRLLRDKKWKSIALYIAAGCVVLAPFLIRNVIISGYLVYPYPELDLFDVDWKMPAYTLQFDRNEIKAWGQELRDVFRFDASIAEWFPVWYERLDWYMQLLFIINIVTILFGIGVALYQIVKRKDAEYLIIVLTIIACLGIWFVGAPLIRYGSSYMLLLPAYVGGEILVRVCRKKDIFRVVVLAVLVVTTIPVVQSFLRSDFTYELQCPDYEWYPGLEEVDLDGIAIYVPTYGDQVGYYPFPSTPYKQRISLLELRSEDLRGGFRMKEEYRKAYVSTYGVVYEENMFE